MPIFVVVIGWSLNEKSKRREFERNEQYNRKLKSYHTALAGIRRMWEAAAIAEMFSSATNGVRVANPEPDSPERQMTAKIFDFLGTVVAYSKFTEDLPPELLQILTNPTETAKVVDHLAKQGTLLAIRAQYRAQDDVTGALATLRIIGAPDGLVRRLDVVRLVEARTQEHGEETDRWYETEIADIERLVREDLATTAKGR